ncbi:MAG TPA: hypothetical protein DEA05_08605 [Rhodobacteraceae bacterium]|jgi:hypothetical protein|nr:hypothetical protein [Paracoccaceae bacterium]
MSDPSDTPDAAPPEPGGLRALRLLVTALTGVMILGVLVVVGLLVTRLTDRAPVLPEEITLPDGTAPLAVTSGPGWYAVVTGDERILVYDATTGRLRQSVTIQRAPDGE